MKETELPKKSLEVITERWKSVVGCENLYQVSNLGRIRSLDKVEIIKRIRNNKKQEYKQKFKGILLKSKLTQDGYYEICLFKNQKRKFIRTHRVVAFAFIKNEKNKPMINHKDCNKLNNNVNNLEWVTVKENSIHAYKNNLVPIRRGSERSNLTEKQVLEIRRLHNVLELNQGQIAKKFCVGRSCIWHIVNRTTWRHI